MFKELLGITIVLFWVFGTIHSSVLSLFLVLRNGVYQSFLISLHPVAIVYSFILVCSLDGKHKGISIFRSLAT